MSISIYSYIRYLNQKNPCANLYELLWRDQHAAATPGCADQQGADQVILEGLGIRLFLRSLRAARIVTSKPRCQLLMILKITKAQSVVTRWLPYQH